MAPANMATPLLTGAGPALLPMTSAALREHDGTIRCHLRGWPPLHNDLASSAHETVGTYVPGVALLQASALSQELARLCSPLSAEDGLPAMASLAIRSQPDGVRRFAFDASALATNTHDVNNNNVGHEDYDECADDKTRDADAASTACSSDGVNGENPLGSTPGTSSERLHELPPGLLGSPELPTIGSANHDLGRCKPCAFVHKEGCATGVKCQFCHLCESGEKKRRKKERKEARKAAREANALQPQC